MKKVEKFFSSIMDIKKDMWFWPFDEHADESVCAKEDPIGAANAIMGRDPKEPEKISMPLWLPTLMKEIEKGLAYLAEQIAENTHKDLVDLYKKIDALEKQVKELKK